MAHFSYYTDYHSDDTHRFDNHSDYIKFPIEIVSQSQSPAVSLTDAKTFYREDRNVENSLIVSLISAAEEVMKEQTGYYLTDTVFRLHSQGFIDVKIPNKPFKSNSLTIYYDDVDGVEQTLSSGSYKVYEQENPVRVEYIGSDLPAVQGTNGEVTENDYPVRLEYTIGYGPTEDSVPQNWKTALKILSLYYWKRDLPNNSFEAVNPLDDKMIKSLISGYKIGRFH